MSFGSSFDSVRWDQELARIVALPRRPVDFDVDVTHWFARPGSTVKLHPVQSRALYDLAHVQGLLGVISVGWGKSIISILAPNAVAARRPLLLIPAQARQSLHAEYTKWSGQFRFFPLADPRYPRDYALHVMTYDELSREKGEELLEKVRPDLVILDEGHRVANFSAARTRRLMRYLRKTNPGCKVVALSGTMTKRSLRNYAHLAELALRHFSPVPSPFRAWSTLKEWSEALDSLPSGATRRSIGALVDLLSVEDRAGLLTGLEKPHELARRAYRSRLVETPGVVATESQSVDCSLYVRVVSPPVPVAVSTALDNLRKFWVVGDEEVEWAMRLWAFARQMAMGFYYRWEWPDDQPDEEWIAARKAWHKEVRDYLSTHSRPGMDSPLQLSRAAEAGTWESQAWWEWKRVKSRPEPPSVPQWIDEGFLVEQGRQWLAEEDLPGIIWYEQSAIGERLASVLDLPLCAEGPRGSRTILDCAERKVSCVASVAAHGEIKNLQAFSRALVTCPNPSGSVWEQLQGRLHRQGQEADEVKFTVWAHTPELRDALRQAKADALYLEQSTSQRQKLNYATLEGWPR